MEPRIAEMVKTQLEKAETKLNAARSLLKNSFMDDAISRAYYSTFHATSAVLLAEGITVTTHSALKTMFGIYLIKTGRIDRKYGKLLSHLKDQRENGDYDIFTDFQETDAKQAIDEAQEFLKEIKRYLAGTYGLKSKE